MGASASAGHREALAPRAEGESEIGCVDRVVTFEVEDVARRVGRAGVSAAGDEGEIDHVADSGAVEVGEELDHGSSGDDQEGWPSRAAPP